MKFRGATGMSNEFEKAFELAKKFGTPEEISMDFASTVSTRDDFACDMVVSPRVGVNEKGRVDVGSPVFSFCDFVNEKGKEGIGNSFASFESGRDCG